MLHPFKLHIFGVKIHAYMCLYVNTLGPHSNWPIFEEFEESIVKVGVLTETTLLSLFHPPPL